MEIIQPFPHSLAPSRAAHYVRMSTEHQQYSPENQLEIVRQYAAAHNMEIVKEYSDLDRRHTRSQPRVLRIPAEDQRVNCLAQLRQYQQSFSVNDLWL
jgi:hypothetical protein